MLFKCKVKYGKKQCRIFGRFMNYPCRWMIFVILSACGEALLHFT